MINQNLPVSIVIITTGRDQVLIDTIQRLIDLPERADEIIIVDQSVSHAKLVQVQLDQWHDQGAIKLIKLTENCIPLAMNTGLMYAGQQQVLFLDDDVIPGEKLVLKHHQAYVNSGEPPNLIAGQIIQPWDKGTEPLTGAAFKFNSSVPQQIDQFMGGNFSVDKSMAVAIGGFDENFVGVAYRFEQDFAIRIQQQNITIKFVPQASIVHLKADEGGTRSFGHNLVTIKPYHSVGEYYTALKHFKGVERFKKIIIRLTSSVVTRHHLSKPWWIPVTLISEINGFFYACILRAKGSKYISARGIG